MKVIVIGLDGARLDVIKKWVKEGHLPAFEKLIKKGTSGNLRTTLPGPHSVPAWTSLFTGRNPGKHNVLYWRQLKERDYKLKTISSKDVKTKRIWNYLSEMDKKCIIVNALLTYPPEKVNGILISGWTTPDQDREYTYPREIKKILEKFNYRIVPECRNRSKESLDRLYKALEARINVVYWLMENYEWDIFINIFFETEILHHLYSSFLDPLHPQYNPEYEKIVMGCYKKIDSFIQSLIDNIPKTTIFVVSDHGFSPVRNKIYLNFVLEKHGFLRKKRLFHKSQYKTTDYIKKIMKITLPETIKKKLQRKRVEKEMEMVIDWEKTRAFCAMGAIGDIYINVVGKYPHGIVSKEEYNNVREDIIEKLKNDPEIGDKIRGIYRREEIFSGPYFDQTPDISIFFNGKCYSNLYKGVAAEPVDETVGFHTLDGIFIAYGTDIKENYTITNAKIVDVTPTILHIFGIPIPRDMDGRVLKEIFKGDSEFAKREIVYQEIDEKWRIRERIRKLKFEGRFGTHSISQKR